MNYLAFTGLINGILSFSLGFFVLLNNRKAIINITYFVFDTAIALFGFGYFFWQLSKNSADVLFWFKILTVGIIYINVTFLHVSLSILGKVKEKKKLIAILYILNTLFVVLNFKSLLYTHLEPRYGFGYWPIPTKIFYVYLLFWFWQACYGLNILYKGFLTSSGHKREQIRYFMIGCIIGFVGGFTNWPLWFNIKFPPYLNILIALHIPLTAYAIIKHRFLDIEVLIKKSLVFAGMFAFAFGVFVAVTLLVSQLVGGGRIISLAISALIIIIGLRPIESFLINATDKFLFQKKYEYKQVLRAFIDEVITLLNLDEIASSTLKLLDQTIHPGSSAVFIYNKLEDNYQLYNSQGLEDKNIAFASSSKLVIFLKKSKEPVVVRSISGIINVSHEIRQEMDQLKAMLCLPLMLHHDLIGFIALGKKKSDEEYTKEDLDILLDLAMTESVAIGNSQLLAEAAQAERSAAIGTMAAGIYHEIGNPLNIINTKIQLFIISVQRGLYRDKSKEEIIEECKSILNHTINQTNRIADITRKLSNFARPSKEFKPEIVDIPQEIEETLAVVGHELELEKIKIEKQFSSDLPNILADRRQIQQIFFNIIKNAGQAIEEAGIITIKAFTSADNKIHIEITDTGKGIPQDKKDRVFEPFFTTKGPGKGTGLGLSIVKQLVWRNKGDILFRSETGKGTTFILEFPKAV